MGLHAESEGWVLNAEWRVALDVEWTDVTRVLEWELGLMCHEMLRAVLETGQGPERRSTVYLEARDAG